MSIYTAAWAASVSRVHRSPRLGAGLTWRRPWPAGFQLILVRVRRSCRCSRVGAAAAAAASSPKSYYKQKTEFSKVRPLMPLLLPKIPLWTRHCCASRGKHLSAGKRANFWVGAKICPFAEKNIKQAMSRAGLMNFPMFAARQEMLL